MQLSQAALASLSPQEREFFIEEWVERQCDRIDNAFCNGRLSHDEYQARMAEMSAEAERLYKAFA